MFYRSVFFALLITGFLFVCCAEPDGSESKDQVGEKLTVTENNLASANNAFGLKLFRQLAAEDPSVNVFISPLSISEALAMTYIGAQGETKSQMASVLEFGGMSVEQVNQSAKDLHAFLTGLDGMSVEQVNQSAKDLHAFLTGLDSSVDMQIANSIWYDNKYNFKQNFISTNRDYYNAEIAPLDMQDPMAAQQINAWVSKNTNGKIKEIVKPPLNPSLVMMLVNAIYFKGMWSHTFPEGRTKDDVFTTQLGVPQTVKMMSQEMGLSYYEGNSFQAVDLPYGDGAFSMLILLPNEGTDVKSLVYELTDSVLASVVDGMDVKTGTIYLPRFNIEYETTLNSMLIALGMKDAFAPNVADFSGIDGKRDLYISDVQHKTLVEVNEEGTVAVGVTSIGIRVTAFSPDQLVFRVDRPFVFAIRERASNTILFIGRITDLSS